MSLPQPKPSMTAPEYLDWEEHNAERHEYVAGEVFAMAGATDVHVTVTTNVVAMLWAHLRGNPCRVYVADMKVRVAAEDAFYYPDVLVTCDERDAVNVRFKEHPVLLVEVLSESTAAFDRGQKFAHYRSLESLQEYVNIPDIRPPRALQAGRLVVLIGGVPNAAGEQIVSNDANVCAYPNYHSNF